MKKIPFTKLAGAGNDYLFLDGIGEINVEIATEIPTLVKKMCDPHRGVGGDGVILLYRDSDGLGMRIWNRDGSEATMCGNGIRCLARLAYERGYATSTLSIKTGAGMREVALLGVGESMRARVRMGKASFEREDVPYLGEKMPFCLPWEGQTLAFYPVSVGNPHAVTFVDNVDDFEEKYGSSLTKNPDFPEGVNIGVAKIEKKTTVSVRVFERGSGETLACGTGATAMVAVGCHLGYLPKGVGILCRMKGGSLWVTQEIDGTLYLEGDARYVAKGVWYEAEVESAF